MLEAINKNNNFIIEVMECIRIIHLEIEKHCNKVHQQIAKE
jgi:hypothetical protein